MGKERPIDNLADRLARKISSYEEDITNIPLENRLDGAILFLAKEVLSYYESRYPKEPLTPERVYEMIKDLDENGINHIIDDVLIKGKVDRYIRDVLLMVIHMLLYTTDPSNNWRYWDEKREKYQVGIFRKPVYKEGKVLQQKVTETDYFGAATQMILDKDKVHSFGELFNGFGKAFSGNTWTISEFVFHQIFIVHKSKVDAVDIWLKQLTNETLNDPGLKELKGLLIELKEFLPVYNEKTDRLERAKYWYDKAPLAYRYKLSIKEGYSKEQWHMLEAYVYEGLKRKVDHETELGLENAIDEKLFYEARIEEVENELKSIVNNDKKSVYEDVKLGRRNKYLNTLIGIEFYCKAKVLGEELKRLKEDLVYLDTDDDEIQKIKLNLTVEEIGVFIMLFVDAKIIEMPKTQMARLISKHCKSKRSVNLSAGSIENSATPNGFSAKTLDSIALKLDKLKATLYQ